MTRRKTARGFTLIELVASIVIMAILSSFSFTGLISLIDVIAAYPSEIAVRQAAYAMMDELMYGSFLNFPDNGPTQKDGIRYAYSILVAEPDCIMFNLGGPFNPALHGRPQITRIFISGVYNKLGNGVALSAAIANVTVTGNGTGGRIFTYRRANGTLWTTGESELLIRRVDIDMTVTLRDRSYRSFSSVAIKDVNST